MLVNVQAGGGFQLFGGRMTSRGQCPRGGACECPRVGAFFKLMTSRGQCPRGGARLVFHPSKFRLPPPGWLATGLRRMGSQKCCCTHVGPMTSHNKHHGSLHVVLGE